MKWAEPPETAVKYIKNAYEDEADELRNHPKRWGLVASFPAKGKTAGKKKENNLGYGVATNIRSGHYVAFRPAGAFESAGRKETDDQGNPVVNVYARYLGEPDAG